MKKLIDPHGRHIHKLRLSLLDACNFRCVYCMPQNPKFLERDKLMTRSEIKRLATSLVDHGIDEIRLTGGEPSMRSDFLEIVEDLSELNLSRLGLTTNGLHLEKYLPALSKTKLGNINFSLDSLNRVGFQAMTGSPHLEKVLESIFMAQELGFEIKLNIVLMKGLNDKEVVDFVNFSGQYGIEVRFLELMRIGEAREHFEKHFISAGEVIKDLEMRSVLTPVEKPIDSTSFNYKLENGADIGFIASESRPFCSGCSRLRLSADGQIRPCLMKAEGFSLINKSNDEILEILLKTMSLKPIERIYDVSQPMNQIGG
jgi:cyclic pyranopterin phosphate synthase